MSRQQRFVCATPEVHCEGSHTQLNPKYEGNRKTHASPKEARDCTIRYHVRVLGYHRGEKSNELHSPNGGPVLVLTRESRFGEVLTTGKAGRFMPKRRSGKIVS